MSSGDHPRPFGPTWSTPVPDPTSERIKELERELASIEGKRATLAEKCLSLEDSLAEWWALGELWKRYYLHENLEERIRYHGEFHLGMARMAGRK